jgi:gas vesicle protein
MDENDYFAGILAGGMATFLSLLFAASRSDVMPAFKASKEYKRKAAKVAKTKGWSISQTNYVAACIGIEALLVDVERTVAK